MRLQADQPRTQRPVAAKPSDEQQKVSQRVDKVNDVLGAQGVAQDSTRVAALATRGAKAAKVADLLAGDKLAIGLTVSRVAQGTTHAAARVAPRAASSIGRIAPDALKGLGAVARVAGKYGPIISIPGAGWDVYKAVKEHDPTQKRQAVANATLSVVGTAVGVAGGLALATPAGLPLLIGSAGLGALQLADSYLFNNKVSQWLGDTGAKLWHVIKK